MEMVKIDLTHAKICPKCKKIISNLRTHHYTGKRCGLTRTSTNAGIKQRGKR